MITEADLRKLCPKAKADIIGPLAGSAARILPKFGIKTDLEFCHFIPQAAHETMGFTTLNELGGSAYFEKRYGMQTAVGRRLGNTQPGDGARFHGRGIFQLTGRANYTAMGKKLGLDLVGKPALAADVNVSLEVAALYWQGRGINRFADADDVRGVTRKINGGTNGLADRTAFLAKAKKIWMGKNPLAQPSPTPRPTTDAAPVEEAPGPVDMTDVPMPPDFDPVIDNLPAIATEAPPSLAKSKTLWSSITTTLGGGGFGWQLREMVSGVDPQIILIAGGFLVVAAISLAIIFRDRIAKRLEHGI